VGKAASLSGVRLLDLGRNSAIPAQLLANREQLSGESGRTVGIGRAFGAMIKWLTLTVSDLVFRPCRRRAEDAAGNLLGFVERVLCAIASTRPWEGISARRGSRSVAAMASLVILLSSRTHRHVGFEGGVRAPSRQSG